MIDLKTVDEQLKCIGCNFRFWGRSEVRELCEVLLPGETIAGCVNGQYEAGFAMLCATDLRVLLIDKKPKYLTLKDIRFDMITELDFSNRMLNSSIKIYTPNRELRFSTPSARRLRKLFTHVQHKVMEVRQHFMLQQQHLSGQLQQGPAMIGASTPTYALPQQQAMTPPNDVQSQMAAAVGAAGLQSMLFGGSTDGTVTASYGKVPFTQRWRRRPYGYSNSSVYQPGAQ